MSKWSYISVSPEEHTFKYVVHASNDKEVLLKYGGLEIARDRSLNK